MPTAVHLIFFALGRLAVIATVRSRRQNARARSWPSTRGRILRCDIGPHDPPGRQIRLHLLYEYEVGAQRFRGDQLQFASLPASDAWWRSLRDQYPVGAEVDVCDDPTQPSNAVLRRPAEAGLPVIGAFGLLFMAFASFSP